MAEIRSNRKTSSTDQVQMSQSAELWQTHLEILTVSHAGFIIISLVFVYDEGSAQGKFANIFKMYFCVLC